MNYPFTSAARRDFRKLEPADRRRIIGALDAYAQNRLIAKKLKDYDPPAWRLRVGQFRILLQRADAGFEVFAISNRRDAYR
jgi:mRNA-degrading endonuclease RelE of RelBE toxin-antitoxin system